MLRAFPVGRFFGIRLDVHASWFIIYAFIAWTLANDAPIAALGPGPGAPCTARAGRDLRHGDQPKPGR